MRKIVRHALRFQAVLFVLFATSCRTNPKVAVPDFQQAQARYRQPPLLKQTPREALAVAQNAHLDEIAGRVRIGATGDGHPAVRLDTTGGPQAFLRLVENLRGRMKAPEIDSGSANIPLASAPDNYPLSSVALELLEKVAAEISVVETNLYRAGVPGALLVSENDPLSPDATPARPLMVGFLEPRRTGRPLETCLLSPTGIMAMYVQNSPAHGGTVYTLDGRLYLDPDNRIAGAYGVLEGIKPAPDNCYELSISPEGEVTAHCCNEAVLHEDDDGNETPDSNYAVPLGRIRIVEFSTRRPLPLSGDGVCFMFAGPGKPPEPVYPGAGQSKTRIKSGSLLFSRYGRAAARHRLQELVMQKRALEEISGTARILESVEAVRGWSREPAPLTGKQIKELLAEAFEKQTRRLLKQKTEPPKTLQIAGQFTTAREFFEKSRYKEAVTVSGGTLEIRFENALEAEKALAECLNLLNTILAVHRQNIANMYRTDGSYAAKTVKIVASDNSPTKVGFEIVNKPAPFKWVKPRTPSAFPKADPKKGVSIPNIDIEEETAAFQQVLEEYNLLREVLKDISGGWTVYSTQFPAQVPEKPDGL